MSDFLLGVAAGAYGFGLLAVLWACTSEPWPDRVVIALFWPVAVVRNIFFD